MWALRNDVGVMIFIQCVVRSVHSPTSGVSLGSPDRGDLPSGGCDGGRSPFPALLITIRTRSKKGRQKGQCTKSPVLLIASVCPAVIVNARSTFVMCQYNDPPAESRYKDLKEQLSKPLGRRGHILHEFGLLLFGWAFWWRKLSVDDIDTEAVAHDLGGFAVEDDCEFLERAALGLFVEEEDNDYLDGHPDTVYDLDN